MSNSICSFIQRAAQTRPKEIATVLGERQQTWTELSDRIRTTASALQDWGIKPGDRVAICALNSDRYMELMYAIPWAGAVAVPMNIRLAPPEMHHWLNDSGARIVFTDAMFAEAMKNLHAQGDLALEQVIGLEPGVCESSLDDFASRENLIGDFVSSGSDLAYLLYTGGTTGRSKGVMMTHDNLVASTLQTLPELDIANGDIMLRSAPMFHAADIAIGMMGTVMRNKNVFIPAFDPVKVLDLIEKERITCGVLVPTMVAMVLAVPDIAERDLSSFRKIYYGASPMPEAVLRKGMELLPHTSFSQAYGQTECGPVLTVLSTDDHVNPPYPEVLRSAGQATPGVELKIVDEDGNELPTGEVGEVIARGNNVTPGYWNLPEVTAKTLVNGWIHTGDGGRLDENGYLYIVDRVKDMIITGGENVYSVEVEQAVYSFPGVAQCAAIGIPHEEWGEQVHVIVVPTPDTEIDTDALIAHCKTQIAGYKCPRSVDIRLEAMPLSGANKILKTELRKPYWEDRDKAVN